MLIMAKGGAAMVGRTLVNKVQNIYSILYNINFTHVKDECRNTIHSQNHPPSAPRTETNGSH
jgi:hypothetical protein